MARCEACGRKLPEEDLTFVNVRGKWVCPPCFGYSEEKLVEWGYA